MMLVLQKPSSPLQMERVVVSDPPQWDQVEQFIMPTERQIPLQPHNGLEKVNPVIQAQTKHNKTLSDVQQSAFGRLPDEYPPLV